jgi:UDP-N-acetylglucosamine:LPS N-acetylglucosamine transferase
VPTRVLIATASVGEGHDAPARVLARALEPDADVELLDVLAVSGRAVGGAAGRGMRLTLGTRRLYWLFDVEYLVFARLGPTRRLGQWLLYRAASARLLDAVLPRRPDVVVATYPIAAEVLGRLRAAARLDVPVCSVVTDLAALHYWAHPGCDLHLVTHPESIAEVERIAGPGSAVAVRGLTAPGFLAPASGEEARRALDIPPGLAVVTVSGGGWGVGDLEGAVAAARAVPGAYVVCVCGHNGRLAARLRGRSTDVRVLGFVDDMATLLAATDVLVHSTAGLTVLEGYMLGCRVISYGLPVGHVRVNERAFARYGLAEVVRRRAGLRAAIERALDEPRLPHLAQFAELPDAAAAILALAD